MVQRLGPCCLACVLLCACNPARGVPIILWHAVGEGSPNDPYDLPADEFDRELSLIESFGATSVTLDQVFDARAGGARLPERAVVLTFDDGRACLLASALPLLQKHSMTAELFVVPAWVAEDEAHRRVHDDAQGRHPYLTWPELAQLSRSGAFHIQSHSMTHAAHTSLTLEQVQRELGDSRRTITEHLGVPVNFFAYPFGGFDAPYRDAVEQAGYRAAVAVGKGPGTRYGLLRHSLHRGEEGTLRAILEGAFGKGERR